MSLTSKTVNAIAALRDKIAPLNRAREELERWSRSRAETFDWVADCLAAERGKARDILRDKLAAVAQGQSLRLVSLNRDGGYKVDDEANDCFAALLIGAAGPELVEALCAEALDDLPLQVDKKTRADRLAAVCSELDKLERAEEALISDAELEGVYIHRRRDVRMEIVLEVVRP